MSKVETIKQQAAANGFEVTDRNGMVTIVKRTPKTRKVSRGLLIYPDGVAFDIMVDCGVAKPLRTLKQLQSVLGITA